MMCILINFFSAEIVNFPARFWLISYISYISVYIKHLIENIKKYNK